MRLLTFIIFFFYSLTTYGTNYYVSAGGSNGNNGLTMGTAWQTIPKVNSMNTIFAIGDSILFRGGDTFLGSLNIVKSGVVGNNIVIASYGIGKATISGLVTLNGWANIGGNIWECTPDSTIKANCNVLTVNGVPVAVGRFPNTTYLTYQTSPATSTTTGTVVSSSLTGSPNYTGAEVVIRKVAYILQRGLITSQSPSNTLNYTKTENLEPASSVPPVTGRANENHGFFIQRFAASLDAQNEWYTNGITMRIYSTVNPNTLTIKASYVDTLIGLGSRTNITVYNLALEGAGRYAVFDKDGINITVKNCDFDNNTLPVCFHNVSGAVIDGCTMENNFNCGIYVYNSTTTKITVTNNTLDKTGQLAGMAPFYSNANLHGIYVHGNDVTTTANYLNVLNNTVIRTGYNGIRFQGSNVLVQRNIVDTFCNVLDDGGGIYTYMDQPTEVHTNRIVEYNFISNSVGAAAGAGGSQSSCIYNDGFTKNVIDRYNTNWNITGTLKGNGIQTSNPVNVYIRNNTIYNTDVCVNTNHITYSTAPIPPISQTFVDSNILYQKTNQTTKWIVRHINTNLQNPPMTIQESLASWFQDNNWISNQQANSYTYYYSATGNGVYSPFLFLMLTQWRASPYFHDINSILPPVPLTSTNSAIYTNPSYTPLTVTFTGFSKIDPKGVVYNNAVLIPAWSSLILIDNGTTTNLSPSANAGADQNLTLPTDNTNLSGSGTDPDGTISSYLWEIVSGPNTPIFGTAGAQNTTITGLIAGTYQIRLTVTDNGGAEGSDVMNIFVAAANIPPVANAGSDQTIQLPNTTTTISGASSTDADGSIISYAWIKLSGPAGGTIAQAANATTGISALQLGTYTYQLTVRDNQNATNTDQVQINVIAAANLPPVANAGPDVTITLPTNSVLLDGTGSSDPDGSIISYSWTHISGPGGSSITSPTASSTMVTGLAQGVHTYALVVTDNDNETDQDLVSVTVEPAIPPANLPPVAQAGTDQTITLPTSSVVVSGSASTDPDGTIVSYAWSKITGPATFNIVAASAATTTINGLTTAGVYTFQLLVTDDDGSTNTDAVQITVLAAPPVAPTANAGSNQTLTLPTNSTTLTGSGADTDGTIISYEWSQVSGPNTAGISTPTQTSTGITGLIQGTYVFQLLVTDNDGLTGTASVQVIVEPAIPNEPPTANAGANQTITLPTDQVDLIGSGSDVDGTITGYQWVQLSGPNTGSFGSAGLQTTTFTGLIEGIYIVQLTVMDDDGDTGTATVQITVAPVPNSVPAANAGNDTTIYVGDLATLSGSGIDADGTITTYAWTGPGTITSASSALTTVSGLTTIGTYTFTLTVTDNDGGIDTDTVTVTVIDPPGPGNLLRGWQPIAN